MPSVHFLPEGMRQLTPHVTVRNCAQAIDFYTRVFGARELEGSAKTADGRIMHATLQIGDSRLMLNDEFPEMGGAPASPAGAKAPFALHLYVPAADAVFKKAIDAGATSLMPVADMFWGDRYGQFADPFGCHWAIATRVENVTPEESNRRAAKMFGG